MFLFSRWERAVCRVKAIASSVERLLRYANCSGAKFSRCHRSRAGRYTGSYRIPVFIFLTIWIFKIPQYRCHLNNVWNATLLERGLFSLLHFGEDTAVCVTKRERSETEAQVECEEREEVIHNIHIDRHKYPPSAASAPASLSLSHTHTHTHTHSPLHQLPRLSQTKVLRRYDGFPSIAGFPPS